MRKKQIFETSSRVMFFQNVSTALFVAVITALSIKFLKNEDSYVVALYWALGAAAVGFLYYGVRFLFKSPLRIGLDENGIVVVWRRRPATILPWSSIQSVKERWKNGGSIRFVTEVDKVVVWDDGFTNADWEALWEFIEKHVDDSKIDFRFM